LTQTRHLGDDLPSRYLGWVLKIFNQNLLDIVGCFFLGAAHAAKLGNVNLSGTRGHWLCLVVNPTRPDQTR